MKAQGTVLGRPHSSALTKLASRPKNKPIGVAAAHKSSTLQELTPRQREKIAVNQPVEDKNQADPENADHIAEHANKVDEETRAKITALDSERNDFEEGTGQRMAEAEPGNSTETRVAQSEESPGEAKRAPNEGAVGRHDGADTPAAKADLGKPNESARSWNDQGKGTSTEKSTESRPAEAARAAERADAGAPETAWSEDGAFSVEKSRAAKEAKAGKKKRLPPPQRKGKPGDLLGLGSGSTTGSGFGSVSAASVPSGTSSRRAASARVISSRSHSTTATR